MVPAELFDCLAAAVPDPADPAAVPLVLCTSRRLAQQLHARYARYQIGRGVAAWPTPEIQTPESYLQTVEEQLRQRLRIAGESPVLPLTEHETDLVWRLVLSEAPSEPTLLREAEAAQLAAQAWRLCLDYDLPMPLPATGADVERFNAWAEAYRGRCRRLGRPDPADARAGLLAALAAGDVPAPRQVVLAGFDRPPPWQARLWGALRDRGASIHVLADDAPAAAPQTCCAPGAEQELRAAARWVRARAERDPALRIGVVVPDLGSRRADVLRIFDQELCPQLDALGAGRGQRPYNLSLGMPLTDYGLPQCALQLLRLCVDGLDLAAAGSLLCARYWGASEPEWLDRADLDRRLREEGHLRVDLGVLQRIAAYAADATDDARPLLQRLRALASLRPQHRRQTPAEWAETFSDWLDRAGWPGPRALDSVDYQLHEAWREVLARFAALGGLLGSIPASAAWHQLRLLAQRRVFQPQTPEVPIQVLGALEAQGLTFDALWVAGLDDEHWPPGGRPNPFIPFELQRRHGLPHASTAHELAWAERMTGRWCGAAPEVVFSWASTDGDRPLAPSPLLRAHAEAVTGQAPSPLAPLWHAAHAQARIEVLADAYAPPPRDDRPVPGGARLLGDQARCPFRAFATHRLGARALEQPGYGLSAIDRGELVHRCLETLWRSLRDQAALCALDDDELAARVAATVDAELARLQRQAPQRLTPALLELETGRLRTLLLQWFALERERPPFAVELLEGTPPQAEGGARGDDQLVSFGGLRLRLRPDRVDRLGDGDELVIDYKTGAKRPLPWHDGRPEEPQLLIYALTRPQTVGVAYARLRQGSVGFDGIADDGERIDGVKGYTQLRETRDASSWGGLMGRWRGELTTLADEVRRGLAGVTPKHPRQSCRDCSLHALCRIHEARPDAAFDDAPEDLA